MRLSRRPLTLSALAAAAALTLAFTAIPASADGITDPPVEAGAAVDQLVEYGAAVAVTGDILEVADLPADQPDLFLALPSGENLTLDEASLITPVEPGQTVSAVVEIPGEVISHMSAASQATLVASPDLEAAADGEIVQATGQTGQVLVAAAIGQEAPVELVQADVVAAPTVSAAPSPSDHQLEFVFMSPQGSGKFWTQAQLDTLVESLAAYWVPQSRGVITGFTYSYETAAAVTTSITCSGSYSSIMNLGAQALGYSSYSAFNSNTTGRHLVVISPNEEHNYSTCANQYGGLANLGGSAGLNSGGWTHLILRKSSPIYPYNIETFVHEIGHNLSLHHAGTATCPDGVVDGPFASSGATCKVAEGNAEGYGDRFNVMGSSSINSSTPIRLAAGLNGRQKDKLALISAGNGLTTISTAGTYDIELVAKTQADGVKPEALKIVNTINSVRREYSVEYDTVAGGVVIRRVAGTGDTSLPSPSSGYPDTVVLSPDRTWPSGPQIFGVGQGFFDITNTLSIRVDQLTETTASVHLVLGGQPNPNLQLSQTTWQPLAPTASIPVQVTTNGATWTASASATWLSATPTAGGNGATMTVRVSENTSSSTRTARLTVRSGTLTATLTVTQAPRPTLSLSRSTWSVRYSGASVTAQATTNQPAWTASSDVPWLTVSPDTGASRQSTRLTAAANPGPARTGLVTISAGGLTRTIRVTQATAPGVVSLDQTTWRPTFEAGQSITVTATTNMNTWSASSGASWLTVTPTAGANATSFTVTARQNTSTSARTSRITVRAGSGRTYFNVTQAGAPSLSLSRTSWSASARGATTTSTVTTNQPSWTAVSNATWLTLSQASGTSGTRLGLTAAANTTGASRSAAVTITVNGVTRTISVSQGR